MKRKYIFALAFTVLAAFAGGYTYAMFTDRAEFSNTLVSVGSADLKLYEDMGKSASEPGNLVDSLPSPSLLDVTPSFEQDYLVKLYNNSTKASLLESHADYITAEDPEDLRRYITVEIYEWNDNNTNGILEGDELGTSMGSMNVIDWKSDGFSLNLIEPKSTRSFVLRFTAPEIPETKMGKTGMFSFEFSTVGQ